MRLTQRRGFTLIELLMVVALIAILSTMILIMLDSGAERAAVNSYFSYGAQMHKVVADSVAAGKFDRGSNSIADGGYCLGSYSSGCGTNGSPIPGNSGSEQEKVFKALTYFGELPPLVDGQGFSPYNETEGVYMEMDRASNSIHVYMYLLNPNGNESYLGKACDSINWTADSRGYCVVDVPLHSRL